MRRTEGPPQRIGQGVVAVQSSVTDGPAPWVRGWGTAGRPGRPAPGRHAGRRPPRNPRSRSDATRSTPPGCRRSPSSSCRIPWPPMGSQYVLSSTGVVPQCGANAASSRRRRVVRCPPAGPGRGPSVHIISALPHLVWVHIQAGPFKEQMSAPAVPFSVSRTCHSTWKTTGRDRQAWCPVTRRSTCWHRLSQRRRRSATCTASGAPWTDNHLTAIAFGVARRSRRSSTVIPPHTP